MDTVRKIYQELVHWKPILYIISKSKCFKIADVVNIILVKTLEDGP